MFFLYFAYTCVSVIDVYICIQWSFFIFVIHMLLNFVTSNPLIVVSVDMKYLIHEFKFFQLFLYQFCDILKLDWWRFWKKNIFIIVGL